MDSQAEKKAMDELIEFERRMAAMKVVKAKVKNVLVTTGLVILAGVGIIVVLTVVNQLEKNANGGQFATGETPAEIEAVSTEETPTAM